MLVHAVNPYGMAWTRRVDADNIDAERGDRAPAELATFVLEFGTQDVMRGLTAFQADNWLHHHGDPNSEVGRVVTQAVLDQFFIDDAGWRSTVSEQGSTAIHAALDGLTS